MIRDDIKDVIKEGWIRKINHPVGSVMLTAFMIAALFTGIRFWSCVYVVTISVQMHFIEHIDFLIPLSDEDRRRRTVIRALGASLFYTAWLGGQTLVSALLYHTVFDAPCFFVVLLHICAFFVMVNVNMPEPALISADSRDKEKSGIVSGSLNVFAVIIVFFMGCMLKNGGFLFFETDENTVKASTAILVVVIACQGVSAVRELKKLKDNHYEYNEASISTNKLIGGE